MKPTCRILWAENLSMSDLTFGPSFKVKRWFTGFGELSFQWIQIASVLRCIGLVEAVVECHHLGPKVKGQSWGFTSRSTGHHLG